MKHRVYGALLVTMLLFLAACGRQLPEEGVPGSSAPVAAQPTEAPEEEPAVVETEEAADDAEATEEAADDAEATEEAADDAEATEEAADDAEATEEAADDAEAEEAASADDDPIAMAIAAGDPEAGAQLFQQQYQTSVGPWICASCHSVDASGIRLVGPGLWGLAETGEARIAESGDESIAEYIHNSIVNPGAYIVPADAGGPYPENLMPPNYGELLSEDDLNNLVAYILTLNE